MSGLYLPGMEMPNKGEYSATFQVYADGSATLYLWYEDVAHEAIPVPPHGRLIDADALCDGLVSNNPIVIYAGCAPTIIPADPAEEETNGNT